VKRRPLYVVREKAGFERAEQSGDVRKTAAG